MCGLTGYLGGEGAGDHSAALRRMADSIAHRGPDDAGYWSDPGERIGLGHRRLSILDLSPAGHQPMCSPGGRYVIAFNGEIYNHLALRVALQEEGGAPDTWRGHSDTETLLAGFETWGVEESIKRSIGMFAFALWDRSERVLTLARDRVGEKPLYYGWQGTSFVFGSELKALRAHPEFQGRIRRSSLCKLLRHSYIPAPHSIYEGIEKLPPGCLLTVNRQQREPRVWPYWSGSRTAVDGQTAQFAGTAEDAVDQLEVLLKDAVRQQMVADVPLGAFLSGGVDSSTIVALMQAQSSRPVRTFSIGFHEEGYDEAVHARAVARHLGTDHTELYVTPEEAMAVIPRLPTIYDEPFSDPSQIPTILVSQLARRQVTVSLSGDAGDELFCGYNRYKFTEELWRRLSLVPASLRGLAAALVTRVPSTLFDRIASSAGMVWPRLARHAHVGDKLHKGAGVMASPSFDSLYLGLVSHWQAPESVVVDGTDSAAALTDLAARLSGVGDVQRMMALDLLTYLPDDILVKVDRAAMSVSLETRVPLLDHRIVEFAWRLPQSVKIRDGQTKWALRQVLYRHVPRSLIERPKMGFGVPIDTWLRGPLREWAEALLDEARLRREGFFHPAPIRKKWDEHLTGRRNWQYLLWDVLMFQAWLEAQGSGETARTS